MRRQLCRLEKRIKANCSLTEDACDRSSHSELLFPKAKIPWKHPANLVIGFPGTSYDYELLGSLLQVVKAVAASIDSFTATYVEYTLAAHAKVLGLGAMKRANLEAYRVLSHRSNTSWHQLRIKVHHALQYLPVYF